MFCIISGQIIEVQISATENKFREFVVGINGSIWPYTSDTSGQHLECGTPLNQTNTSTNTVDIISQDSRPLQEAPTDKKSLPSTLEQILRGNLDVQIREGGVIEFVRQHTRSRPASNNPITKSKPIVQHSTSIVQYPNSSQSIAQTSLLAPLNQSIKAYQTQEPVPAVEPRSLITGPVELSAKRLEESEVTNTKSRVFNSLTGLDTTPQSNIQVDSTVIEEINNPPESTKVTLSDTVLSEALVDLGNHIRAAENLLTKRDIAVDIQEVTEVSLIV